MGDGGNTKIFQTVSHNIYKEFLIVKTDNLNQLEETLQTLGDKGDLSFSKKQAIRDKVFQSIGQVELADAIVKGEQKATIAVSLQYLKKALIPHKLTFSIPVTLAVMIFIFASSVMTGALAQNSNPTGTLFPIKLILEKIELAFISNPVDKAEFRLDIAGERLKYLETSINQEDSLSEVLTESQVALVDARTALNKAKTIELEEGDDQGIPELIERFSQLLDNQKNILNNIEEKVDNDEIKQTIIAVRDILNEKLTEEIEEIEAGEGTTSVVLTPTTAVKVDEVNIEPPVLEGYHRIIGRIGTAYSKPAIIIGNRYYQIVSSPVDLSQHIGWENIELGGEITNNQMIVTRVVVNGIVLVDILSDQ